MPNPHEHEIDVVAIPGEDGVVHVRTAENMEDALVDRNILTMEENIGTTAVKTAVNPDEIDGYSDSRDDKNFVRYPGDYKESPTRYDNSKPKTRK
jgi:hypothetical protein